jgi:hypothetical protein
MSNRQLALILAIARSHKYTMNEEYVLRYAQRYLDWLEEK